MILGSYAQLPWDVEETVSLNIKYGAYETTVEELQANLQHLIESPPHESINVDEWLRALYESYTERFIRDNDRIWTTGSIMIPLSLAAFAALPTISCPKLVHLLTLGIASFIVMFSWLVIAENHRAFQQKSKAWLSALENVIGLQNTGRNRVRSNRLNRMLTFPGAVQKMRWVLTFSTLIGWIMVWIFWPRCA